MRALVVLLASLLPLLAIGGSSEEALLRGTEWLSRHLDDPEVVVLHVDRDRRSYDEAHVPGARFLPFDSIAVDRDVAAELPSIEQLEDAFEAVGVSDESRVVLYGGMDGIAPARAFLALDVLGRGHRAALLDGGLDAWKRERRPVSTDLATPSRGALTPRPELDRVVDADWVHARLDDPNVLLLDVRSPEEFREHIPGAKNLPWRNVFSDGHSGRLRDRDSLRAMFGRAGARRDRTIVVYCDVGRRAAFAYFVSRYLGYDTKIYDGSWADWRRRPDLPVER